MMITRTNTIAAFVLLLLFALAVAGPAVAEERFGGTSRYQINGYTFDYDAVTETEGGLQLELSRFKPLMITNSASDILTDDPFLSELLSQTGKSAPHGFAVAAEFLATPSLAFHGAIGVTKGNWDANASLDTESSWEANIGVVYNFFDTLAYEVHFGYLDTGDVFEQKSSYSDVDAIIMISNQLTMSF
ncbi:MAG: hypothetical protein HKP41_07760 [Desulfobacterales bacterium]|nr:hypothetical protein [Desulfobacterales bacterium]